MSMKLGIHGVAALAGACALAGCATLQDAPTKEAVVAAAARRGAAICMQLPLTEAPVPEGADA